MGEEGGRGGGGVEDGAWWGEGWEGILTTTLYRVHSKMISMTEYFEFVFVQDSSFLSPGTERG